MKQGVVLFILFLGCLSTQVFGNEGEEAAAAVPADGGATQAVEHLKKGVAEAIHTNPENAGGYLNFGSQNFEGIKTIFENYFKNKGQEGDIVKAVGKTTKEQAATRQGKIQTKMYEYMFKGFKAAEDDMVVGLNPNGLSGGNTDDGLEEEHEEAPKEAPAAAEKKAGEKKVVAKKAEEKHDEEDEEAAEPKAEEKKSEENKTEEKKSEEKKSDEATTTAAASTVASVEGVTMAAAADANDPEAE